MSCCYGDDVMGIAVLLQASGDADQTDFSGNTPLHVAASLGNAQLINLLVSGGADCTVKNLEGETPLDLAKLKEHDEVGYVHVSLI